MDPRRKPDPQEDESIRDEGPSLEQPDWEAVGSGEIAPDSIPQDGDLGQDAERPGEVRAEDDDNPYQNSDEALPGDKEEAAIERDPSREGGRFDEV